MSCFVCGESGKTLSQVDGFKNCCNDCVPLIREGKVKVSYGKNPDTNKLSPKYTWPNGKERWA